jgi:hypothetical protein
VTWRESHTVRRFSPHDNDLAGRYVYAVVPKHWLADAKFYRGPILCHRAKQNSRKTFADALHPEPAQVDLHELGAEITLCGRTDPHPLAGSKGRLILTRISKLENAA